jgi:hypothetical protein
MTAHVLTDAAETPGRGGRRPAFAATARPIVMKRYLFDMGTDNYSVNGDSISTIWDDFQEVLHISVEQQDTSTAADRRDFAVDYTAKTLLVYTAFNTESTATDQGVVTVSLMVFGY